jgi:hypothetical protein
MPKIITTVLNDKGMNPRKYIIFVRINDRLESIKNMRYRSFVVQGRLNSKH